MINAYMGMSKRGIAEMLYDTITRYEAKIKELELIIKDKDVIIEPMAHGKSCENCTYFDGLACMINNNCFRFNSDYEDSFEPKVNQDVK